MYFELLSKNYEKIIFYEKNDAWTIWVHKTPQIDSGIMLGKTFFQYSFLYGVSFEA